MKVSKIKQSKYTITLHEHKFTLVKLYGDNYWTLWNAKLTEINRAKTKRGMLELMEHWTPAYAEKESQHEFCPCA